MIQLGSDPNCIIFAYNSMKKVLICLCLLIACSFSKCAQPDDVQKRVEEIYSNVRDVYLKHYEDGKSLWKVNLDSLYYSEELYRLDNQIGDLEEELGGPLIHDCDLWIHAQDFTSDLAFRVLRVKMDGNKKAYVTINIHCFGDDEEEVLTMVYERDNWFIDDKFDGTLKKQIRQELKEYGKK